MKLREEFKEVINFTKLELDTCETICDNFAIGFLLWVYKNAYNYPTKTEEQLLTIYKETL